MHFVNQTYLTVFFTKKNLQTFQYGDFIYQLNFFISRNYVVIFPLNARGISILATGPEMLFKITTFVTTNLETFNV